MYFLRYCISFILLWISNLPVFSQNDRTLLPFNGIIIDSVTSEPIANVIITNIKTKQLFISDSLGRFQINTPIKSEYFAFQRLGYKSKSILLENSKIFLIPVSHQISEITVTGNDTKNIENVNTGSIKLSRIELKKLPLLLGESDFFKLLQLMPGIQNSGEGNAAIYVRGGGFDQNLILLDNSTVYNASHLLGFYSVFNSDVISSVKVFKSGISAEYGNRLSSVMEFNTSEKMPTNICTKGNIGVLSVKVGVDIPIITNKLFISLAARKTYLNSWLDLFKEKKILKPRSILYKSRYSFYDLNSSLVAVLPRNNKLSLSFYNGKDIFKLNSGTLDFDADLNWGNNVGSLTWNKSCNQNIDIQSCLIYSGYRFNMDFSQNQFKYNLNSEIYDYGFKNKILYNVQNQNIIIGLAFIHHNVAPNTSSATTDNIALNLGTLNRYYSTESSIYISDKISLNKRTDFSIGFRGNSYSQLGNFSEYVYDESGNVTDTIQYKKGECIKTYWGGDIRSSFRYLLKDNLSLKISFDSNHQYLHLINSSSVAFPADFWVGSSRNIKPQHGYQWASGIYYFAKKPKINISVELYYKIFSHQIEFKNGIFNISSLYNTGSFERNLIFGKGRAYGVEFLIQKSYGKFSGWIGYTLSRTEKSFEAIENSRWFLAKYDRPHDLSVVSNYQLNTKWTFSAVFVFSSGTTYTPVIGRYFLGNNVINEYGSYNSARMPAYHRCDISATLLLKKTERTESKINFSVYNVYNRHNPFFIYPKSTGDLTKYSLKVEEKKISIFPILPSISWEFQF
jgi:hypothetical protein